MVNAFLKQPIKETQGTEAFLRTLLEGDGLKGIGGFSLVCGKLGEPLAVISNRTPDVEGVTWLASQRGETVGLSNAAFGDRSWPKVTEGEELMETVIARSMARSDNTEAFVEEMMKLLSTETLPKRQEGQGWDAYVKELRKSILIPKLGGEGMDGMRAEDVATAKSDQHVQGLSGVYGTQQQTVVLVDHQGHVTFVERTLYDNKAQVVEDAERDKWFEFDIKDWAAGRGVHCHVPYEECYETERRCLEGPKS